MDPVRAAADALALGRANAEGEGSRRGGKLAHAGRSSRPQILPAATRGAEPLQAEEQLTGTRPQVAQRAAAGLSELRFGDLVTFLAVQKSGSVTGAARELSVTPSQVSKAVTRIERALRMKLFVRGPRGVELSEAGRRALAGIEGAVSQLRRVRSDQEPLVTVLSVAAPSYLLTALLPPIACSQKHLRVRGLELPPALVRGFAGQNLFDLALLPGGLQRLPSSWTQTRAGEIRVGLFGSPAVAARLGAGRVTADDVRRLPFIAPLSVADGQWAPADDDCPLALSERQVGHEVQTIPVALEMAARTDHVVFGPWLAARGHVERGELVEIRVQGWSVTEPLYLACNSDRVLARVQQAVVRAVQATLERSKEAGP